MKVLNPEVYRICYEYAHMKSRNGDINPNFLETICRDILERKIETAEEAKEHFRAWVRSTKGREQNHENRRKRNEAIK